MVYHSHSKEEFGLEFPYRPGKNFVPFSPKKNTSGWEINDFISFKMGQRSCRNMCCLHDIIHKATFNSNKNKFGSWVEKSLAKINPKRKSKYTRVLNFRPGSIRLALSVANELLIKPTLNKNDRRHKQLVLFDLICDAVGGWKKVDWEIFSLEITFDRKKPHERNN